MALAPVPVPLARPVPPHKTCSSPYGRARLGRGRRGPAGLVGARLVSGTLMQPSRPDRARHLHGGCCRLGVGAGRLAGRAAVPCAIRGAVLTFVGLRVAVRRFAEPGKAVL